MKYLKIYLTNLTVNVRINIFFILMFLIYFYFACNIMPFGDDWGYSTEPKIFTAFPLEQLYPSHGHWRPLEVCYGWFLGYVPFVYPYLNHFIIVVSHVLIGKYIFSIIQIFTDKIHVALFASVLFIFHSNTIATTLSVDSINQSLSLLFGVIAIFKFSVDPNRFIFFSWVILSVMAKESGFIFFTAAPVLATVIRSKNRMQLKDLWSFRNNSGVLCGLILTCFYFVFTFNSSLFQVSRIEEVRVLNDFYYNPVFGTLALIGRIFQINLPLLLSTDKLLIGIFIFLSILTLPFYFLIIVGSFQNKKFLNLFSLMVILYILLYSITHSHFNAITEMNSYPVIFLSCLLIGYYLSDELHFLKLFVVFIFVAILMIFNFGFKYHLLINQNKAALKIASEIQIKAGSKPRSVFVILIDPLSNGHDIYQYSPIVASGSGRIMKQFYNDWSFNMKIITLWKNADGFELVRDGDVIQCGCLSIRNCILKTIKEYGDSYEQIWILQNNGIVNVIKTKS